jgi:hypothetical protein
VPARAALVELVAQALGEFALGVALRLLLWLGEFLEPRIGVRELLLQLFQ